jgi:hypothetical protein
VPEHERSPRLVGRPEVNPRQTVRRLDVDHRPLSLLVHVDAVREQDTSGGAVAAPCCPVVRERL